MSAEAQQENPDGVARVLHALGSNFKSITSSNIFKMANAAEKEAAAKEAVNAWRKSQGINKPPTAQEEAEIAGIVERAAAAAAAKTEDEDKVLLDQLTDVFAEGASRSGASGSGASGSGASGSSNGGRRRKRSLTKNKRARNRKRSHTRKSRS